MNRFCPACHRSEASNANTLTPERETCPRDFFKLQDGAIEDPIKAIFGGTYETESCVLPGQRHAIFKVVEPSTGRRAMVSVLRSRDTDTARLIKFVDRWQQINHANILPVTTSGASADKEYLYVVSEYPQGKALTNTLDEQGNIPTDVAVQIFLQLCEALQKINDAGIFHGNIMPAHVFEVQESDLPHHIKLSCDAALTRFLNSSPGAVPEMSPLYLGLEFINGETPSASTDVYSLGCAMYGVLTGLPPFSGKTFDELKQSHMQEQPLSLRGAAPDLALPGLFDKLVLRALRKDPAERHPGMKELKEDLLLAAEKSRIYLPTYMNATYAAQPYTGDTGAYKTQPRKPGDFIAPADGPSGPPPASTSAETDAQVNELAPETRVELEDKVKDLRSHVYLVTGIAVVLIIGLAAALCYEGPVEDHAPAWKKLSWTIDMANAENDLSAKNFEKAKEGFTNALQMADSIQDGGDRKVKTLRKLRRVHEEMRDKKGAEKLREEIIKMVQQRLKLDEAPVK
jgi:hypothetical protein